MSVDTNSLAFEGFTAASSGIDLERVRILPPDNAFVPVEKKRSRKSKTTVLLWF